MYAKQIYLCAKRIKYIWVQNKTKIYLSAKQINKSKICYKQLKSEMKIKHNFFCTCHFYATVGTRIHMQYLKKKYTKFRATLIGWVAFITFCRLSNRVDKRDIKHNMLFLLSHLLPS